MINELTKEQELRIPEWRDKWLKIGLSTEPLDFESAKQAAIECYTAAGLKPPYRFYRFTDPVSAAIGSLLLKTAARVKDQVWDQVRDQVWDQVRAQVGAQVGDQVGDQVRAQVWDQVRAQVGDQVGDQVRAQVWDQVRDQVRAQVRDQVRAQVRAQVGDQVGDQVWDQVGAQVWDQVRAQVWAQVGDQIYGSHDAGWLSFYSFFDQVVGFDCKRMRGLFRMAESCGWWAPYDGAIIFQDRPEKISMVDGVLHCEDGAAIRYPGGIVEVFAWRGIRIPGEWIKAPPNAKTAITWDNVEQRRAACEIVGWANVLEELNARTINQHSNPMVGELLEVDLPDVGTERFLRVRCGTGRDFALPVPPDMDTAENAQRWLNFIPDDIHFLPEIRT